MHKCPRGTLALRRAEALAINRTERMSAAEWLGAYRATATLLTTRPCNICDIVATERAGDIEPAGDWSGSIYNIPHLHQQTPYKGGRIIQHQAAIG